MKNCITLGCLNPAGKRKGYCNSCYYKIMRTGTPYSTYKSKDGKCSSKDCQTKRHAYGFCTFHQFQAEKRYIIRYYSNGTNKCSCCNETHIEFLSIDHINGGGTKHRKQINNSFYRWLIKNNLPKGYQILCMNCNFAKGIYGVCPHKIECD